MTELDLQNWLLTDGIKDDLNKIVVLTVTSEIDNLNLHAVDGLNQIDWQRLLLAGSIIARSKLRIHREAALRIATAALTLDTPTQIKDAGSILLDKLSNHRAISLACRRDIIKDNLNARLGTAMRLESQRRLIENSVLVESTGEWLQVNDFQREFWNGATGKSKWLSASAPTASGKTFLVLQWLIDKMRVTEARVAVYLAPTRALVTEIEENLLHLLKDEPNIDVSSLPLSEKYNAATTGDKKSILVFTQERLHLLLNLIGPSAAIDLLVVDEAHKIGDNQRGVILQDAVERLTRSNTNIKVVFISPATQNPEALLEDAPIESQTLAVDSDNPTVLQNILIAEQVKGKPKLWEISLRNGSLYQPIGVLTLPNSPSTLKKKLAFIAAAAGERGGTLIYANGAAEAEDVAFLISQLVKTTDNAVDRELAALADLARKGVHKNYQLAPLVEKGVAFHYGNMPSLIRTEIERLFKEGKIRFLVCTSTLIEGVNLSCRTIVVRGPRKGKGNPMEPHDFWNLAGRAGRWGNEFQGNIVCVEPHDTRAWPIGVPTRARYPIYRETDAVIDQGEKLCSYLGNRKSIALEDLEDVAEFEQVGAYLLATYLRLGSITDASFAKRHDKATLQAIEDHLRQLASDINIPQELITRHPGVSAVGMQNLLNSFRSYSGDIENLLPYPPDSNDAYDRFAALMERINEQVFPAFYAKGIPLYSLIILDWLKGYSLASIIKKRIEYHVRNNKPYKLPKLIRDTMDIVEQTARFMAPKYLSAYVDVLKLFLSEVKRDDMLAPGLDIGVALEFGVSSRTLLSLMELGLSRMSAVALYEKMVRDDLDKNGCLAWAQEHHSEFEGMAIPEIILREVRTRLLVPATIVDPHADIL